MKDFSEFSLKKKKGEKEYVKCWESIYMSHTSNSIGPNAYM